MRQLYTPSIQDGCWHPATGRRHPTGVPSCPSRGRRIEHVALEACRAELLQHVGGHQAELDGQGPSHRRPARARANPGDRLTTNDTNKAAGFWTPGFLAAL